jgi:rhamnosyl/mannosyltransferase
MYTMSLPEKAMSKMNVLQINKFYYPVRGGIERVVQQIAEGLQERCETTVLVCQQKGPRTFDVVNGVTVHRAASLGVQFSTPLSPDFFSQFRRLRKQQDILHIHMPFPLADIAVWLFGFRGKIVVWWHSDVVRQKKLLFFYKPFMHHLLQRADVIITATHGHIDGSAFLPRYKKKCVVIPFGVDSVLLERSAQYLAQQTACESHSENPTFFLFVGRLVYYKGLPCLLDAMAKVPDAVLDIIGDGPLELSLRAQAERLGIKNRVHFNANLTDDELARTFAKCDVFVLPSIERSEAFGLVQIEAMAYEKPVINTRLSSGVPFVSLDGVTGITVEPGNSDELATAMNMLARDPALRKKYGQAGRRRVQAEYAMDKMLDRVYRIYETLINS